jgi:S1-C subfamily serine protease
MNRLKRYLSMPFGAGVAGGLVVGFLGLLAIATGLVDTESEPPAPAAIASTPPLSEPVADGGALSAGQIFEAAGPAVAFIEAARSGGTGEASPFGEPGGGGVASGSGFLVDDDGTIITNAHVVEGSDEVKVQLGEDGEPLDAELVGADSSTDVAVLRVDAGKVEATPLEFGRSENATVGDAVVAIGNPFGLARTVTTGIVSGLHREITAPDGFTISEAIQTDAAINPGNSGGPLLDSAGRVIGITSQIATAGGGGNVGVGFAVPISTASNVADQILDDGSAEHAYIGISGVDVTPALAEAAGIDGTSGALIQDVTASSPADQAGLEAGEETVTVEDQEILIGGDVITAVDGEAIEGMNQVAGAVSAKAPGDQLQLEVSRDGESRTVELTLAERPDQSGS